MLFNQPLADQMRPHTLNEMVGQQDLLGKGKPLRQIIDQKVPVSLLLWGPPGTGKSSLARIIAKKNGYAFASFNASIDNKAKLLNIINTYPNQTFVLLIDEIHRMTKNLQDFLLPYLENGHIIMIGATTENPIMSMVPAVRSRCQIFEFKALTEQDIQTVLNRAVKKLYSNQKFDQKAVELISVSADGDLRVALNILEVVRAINPDKLRSAEVKQFVKGVVFCLRQKSN